jgi:hypothetical protein
MAADLTLTIDDAALHETSLDLIRDAYRRTLTGLVCRTHGRGVRISEPEVVPVRPRRGVVVEPDTTQRLLISGCCEAFVREARLALTN